jgi:hypothetical protein
VCTIIAQEGRKLTRPVPVNLKERDEFHLTLEEYLQSLISLVEELVRKSKLPLAQKISADDHADTPCTQCSHSR